MPNRTCAQVTRITRRRIGSAVVIGALLLTAGCDDCVIVYKNDPQTGLLIASGCDGTFPLATAVPTPTPTPR